MAFPVGFRQLNSGVRPLLSLAEKSKLKKGELGRNAETNTCELHNCLEPYILFL
jgi:hypothetical protein